MCDAVQGPTEETRFGHKYIGKLDRRGYAVCNNCGCSENTGEAAMNCDGNITGRLQDFACAVSELIWGGDFGWERAGLDVLLSELKKRLADCEKGSISKDGKLWPYSRRIGDVELKTCDDMLLNSGDHTRMEIVDWFWLIRDESREQCNHTLAMWVRSKEGFDLQFVGRRPFEMVVDQEAFWRLAKEGQLRLDKFFEESRHD